jgi:hypothetical protein
MLGTFCLYAFWSFRNGLRVKLRRLRQPRYLVGALAGVAWFAMMFGRPFIVSRRESFSLAGNMLTHPESTQFLVALSLLALTLLVGLRPGKRSQFAFTPAEVQLLFPAPITRRQLLHYKILGGQAALFFGTLLFTVVSRPAAFVQGWTLYLGLWIALTAFRLYSMGSGLASLSLASHGLRGFRRQWGFVTLIVGAVAVLAATAVADWPRLAQAIAEGQHWAELRRIWSAGPARVVLWPFMTVARLVISGSAPAFLSALPGAVLVALGGYLWVIRADVGFEEATAAQAAKQAETGAPARPPRAKATPFTLALEGRPEIAILWKNLISLGRHVSPKLLVPFLPIFILPLVAGRGGGSGKVALIASLLCLNFAVVVVIAGSGGTRSDLRGDLAKLGILKTWPLPGAVIVRGALLAPAIVVSVLACLLVLAAALLLGHAPPRSAKLAALFANRASYAAAAMLVIPGIVLAQLLALNAIALLFPAWNPPDKTGQSPDVAGPRILVMLGGLVLGAVILLPGMAGAALVMAVLRAVTHTTMFVLPAAVLLAVVVGEFLLLARWLGRVFERTDVTAVD